MKLRSSAGVVGMACRLPGAPNQEALWRVLTQGLCTVAPAPEGRWATDRFLHPRAGEPGYSYTFAGGYLDDPFGFDPAPFGISPREAAQIDPQQRLLLEVTWEALEDAGIPAARLAGERVGVYVGLSNVDYQSGVSVDPAAIESHFVTGIALSIASNRISHAFDWKGPSMTIDTACSSSIVALAQALDALARDEIETAVVAGANMLLSPAPFIGFSRAGMLSPTGLCRPFSAEGDGYVRSEGAVALVIRKREAALAAGDRIRSVLLGGAVNSDGRTVGISLPSAEAQRDLLEGLYDRLGINPADLAFVEAHGTGTRVGDPIEARAIGEALGRHRTQPLPIGSVKSNIGHLEPASGVAGLAKSILSLEHGVYPRTLHLSQSNPDIPFGDLGLAPAREDTVLRRGGEPLVAGLCNYGFGGTNAHVVFREATATEVGGGRSEPRDAEIPPEVLLLSAHTDDALSELAARYADLVREDGADADLVARAAAHQRDRLGCRLVVPLENGSESLAEELRAFARGEPSRRVERGAAPAQARTAFVYAGNGSQWAGMGRAACARNTAFSREMQEIEELFQPMAGWSLLEALYSDDIEERLESAEVAQPLLFAVQSALTAVLADKGIHPHCVIGHSGGEVAAAEASGAISREQAIKLILDRGRFQSAIHGLGGMVAVGAGEEVVRDLLRERDWGLDIAAVNSPSSTTVSGCEHGLHGIMREARRRRIAAVRLDVAYPFHSAMLDGQREVLIESLGDLRPAAGTAPFISTVTGGELAGDALAAGYWWRNMREAVRFDPAIRHAAHSLGITLFLEISPRPTLVGAMNETIREIGGGAEAVHSFSRSGDGEEADPVTAIVARLLSRGAEPAGDAVVGSAPERRIMLPSYPWQRQCHVLPQTGEGLEAYGSLAGNAARHPLIGYRMAAGSPEWRTTLDARTVPYLADHKVGGEVVVPGAALLEMALAVGRSIHGEVPLELEELDIVQALVLPSEGMREVSVRYHRPVRRMEIWSRARFSDDWVLHARASLAPAAGEPAAPIAQPDPETSILSGADEVYGASGRAGLDYGPAFRRVARFRRDRESAEADLCPACLDAGAFDNLHLLDPSSLDAAFHGMFLVWEQEAGETHAFLPVRLRRVRLWRPSETVTRTRVRQVVDGERLKILDATLLDERGEVVAEAEGVVLRRVVLSSSANEDRVFRTDLRLLRSPARADAALPIRSVPTLQDEAPGAWLLTRAFAVSLAFREIERLAAGAPVSIVEAVGRGEIAAEAAPLLGAALQVLAEGDLAREEDGGWQLAAECPYPEPESLLAALAERFPSAQAELSLSATALARLGGCLRSGEGTVPRTVEELFERESTIFVDALGALEAILGDLKDAYAPRCPRVLFPEPWSNGLLQVLLAAARRGEIELLLGAMDAEARCRLPTNALGDHVKIVELGSAGGPPVSPLERADALVMRATEALPGDAERLLAGDCTAIVLQPPSDPVLDLLFGMGDGWFSATLAPNFPVGRNAAAEDAEAFLDRLGFDTQEGEPAVAKATLRIGWRSARGGDASPLKIHLVGAGATGPLAAGVAAIAAQNSDHVAVLDLPTGSDGGSDALPQVRDPILRLAEFFRQASREAGERPRIWVVTQGAFGRSPEAHPGADALWAFVRVAMNEYPALDIRLADLSPALGPEDAASLLMNAIAEPGGETELLISAEGVHAPRVSRGAIGGEEEEVGPQNRTVLRTGTTGGIDSFTWDVAPRTAPGRGEVEIEIAATGLNFRDIMLGMGLLDEEIAGAGLSEASLGFEFAGHVARVGEGIADLNPGDIVMGFGRHAFASHVVVGRRHVFRAPGELSAEEAASVPVAFSTAWFALKEVARLREGETLLLHGAVGGVGMAAMQIAQAIGARVIATAGSPERRGLARALGACAAYDSRSLDFADRIRRDFGGVDVVLNSLAGDAMTASLKLLRPFGRFVELGKRDFMENTAVGLRPFVRNLSYHGVDLDELLRHDPQVVDAIVERISEAFAEGTLSPLPYRMFEGEEVSDAFRLMQKSGHVGKVLVRPARRARTVPAERAAFVPAPGVHVVLGGTSGFGFETALWLLDRGAARVVVASRRGLLDDVASERAARCGDRLVVERLDVTDGDAVEALMGRIRERHGPVAGVIHTAMVLEDGLIEGLAPDSLGRVLAPKIRGITAADVATQGDDLQYFVAYSSATTLIGSPGQGAYVAANAYLEGFMRRRRATGRPGLAVAWGAISDAGVIARDSGLGDRLAHTVGVTGIPAEDALAHLGKLLAAGPDVGPVQTYTAMGRSVSAGVLRILATPAFAAMRASSAAEETGGSLDLAQLTAGMTEGEALEHIALLTREEVARILRLSPDEIELRRPLSDIGMDSLMALELRLSIEKRYGLELPLLALGNRSVSDVAASLLSVLRTGAEDSAAGTFGAQLKDLAAAHSPDSAQPEVLASAAEAVEYRIQGRVM